MNSLKICSVSLILSSLLLSISGASHGHGSDLDISHENDANKSVNEIFGRTHHPQVDDQESSFHGKSHVHKPGNHINFSTSEAARKTTETNYLKQSPCGGDGADGEGCAEFLNTEYLVAGENSRFTIRFTAGESGIPIGGGVSIGVHHASSWPTQIASSDVHGYVKIGSNNAGNFSMEHHMWAPAGMLSTKLPAENPDWIFHNVIIAKVTNASVLPGESIDFVFGANEKMLRTQRYVDPDHEFRVTTDIDGDGTYFGVAKSPTISVKHAKADAFSATAPSQAAIGKPFKVLIRAEDSNYNIDEAFQGYVTLKDENGLIVGSGIQLINGLGRSEVTLNSLGPHRLRIESDKYEISGRSNPIRVFDKLPTTGLYWADLHGHTGVSDGLGKDAVEYFKFGRDIAALDIIALTDHGYNDWPANIAAVKSFYDPGSYVTILALEGGGPSSHTNLYYRRDDTAHIMGWPANYPSLLNAAMVQYNADSTNPEVMAAPHHFTYDVGSTGEKLYPFEQWDDRVARFVEVYSSHGTNEFLGNPRPLGNPSSNESKYMQGGLAAGLKFGVIAASDNHDSRPGRSIWGRYPNGLAAIWADNLTRDDVWNALWNRSTYGTSIDRIYMEYYLNQQPMGSDITTEDSINIDAYIIGKTDSLNVSILKNNIEIKNYHSTNGVVEISYSETPDEGQHFYYLRVTQENGERAWSTPIWVKVDTAQSPPPSDPEPTSAGITITVPEKAGMTLGFGSSAISGYAVEHNGSDLKEILIAIRNVSEMKWVDSNGRAVNWLESKATLINQNPGTYDWHLPIDLPIGHYRVFVRSVHQNGSYALDSAGNPKWESLPFFITASSTIDSVSPTVVFTNPETSQQIISGTSIISGVASDTGGSGLKAVSIAIYNSVTRNWIDTTGDTVIWQTEKASLSFNSPHSAGWTLPISLPTGNYRVFAIALDNAGNSAVDSAGNPDWTSIPFSTTSVEPDVYVAPVTNITTPAFTHQGLAGKTSLKGTVRGVGGPGIRTVLVAIYSSNLGTWSTTSGNSVDWHPYAATLTETELGNAAWELSVDLPIGIYRLFAIGIDNDENVLLDANGNYDWTPMSFRVSAEF